MYTLKQLNNFKKCPYLIIKGLTQYSEGSYLETNVPKIRLYLYIRPQLTKLKIQQQFELGVLLTPVVSVHVGQFTLVSKHLVRQMETYLEA